MSRLKNVEREVRLVLESKPETRDDDDLLYLEICKGKLLTEVISLEYFLRNRKSSCIPPFESVRRTRAKLQRENENLRGWKHRPRLEAQQDYLDYVRGEDGRD